MYKVFVNLTKSLNEEQGCFPDEIILELFNIDNTNLDDKLLHYTVFYLVLTLLQIYVMTYEYLKLV